MIQNILSTLLLTSLVFASLVSAYPREWITNEAGVETAYVVPRSQLESHCEEKGNVYTCVSVSQDVTRVEGACPKEGETTVFGHLFNRREEACDDIHCRETAPVVVEFPQRDCNVYEISMTLDGHYLNSTVRDAFLEITRKSFDAVVTRGDAGTFSSCRPNPVGPPDILDGCWEAGPTDIVVSIYGGEFSGQFMETSLSVVKEDEPNGCDIVLGALRAAIGRISPEASGILGAVSPGCQ